MYGAILSRAGAFLAGMLIIAAAANAADLKSMMESEGDWEMTVTGGFMPPTTQRACYRGDKTMADLTTAGLKNCGQQSIQIGADQGVVDAVCTFMNMRVSVHALVTPTGDAAVHAESRVHLEGKSPIPNLPSEMNLSIDAHRLGPCQPGERVL